MSERTPPRREQFFLRCREACAAVFGEEAGCVCPLCGRGFTEAQDFTVEHVPPKSVGGTAMCVTCRECNSRAGHRVDYTLPELARMAQMGDAIFRGQGSYEGETRVTVGGHTTNAIMAVGLRRVDLVVDPERNDPARVQQQLRWIEDYARTGGGEIRFDTNSKFKYSHARARVSLLRAAYLAAFALYGYTYAFNRRLNVVRAQIADPDQEIVPPAALNVTGPEVAAATEPIIAVLHQPLPALAVLLPAGASGAPFGVSVVLPALEGPAEFYEALVAHYRPGPQGRTTRIEGTPAGWPVGPQLALDFSPAIPAQPRQGAA